MSNWKSRNDHKNVAWLPFQSWRLNTEVATDTIPPPPPLNGKNGWTMEWQELRSYFASDGVDKWLKVVGSIHFFISKSFIFKPLPAPPPPPPPPPPPHIKEMVSFGKSGAKNQTFGESLSRPQIMFVVGIIYSQVYLPKTIHKPSVERNYK